MRLTLAGQQLVAWLKGEALSQEQFASRVTEVIRGFDAAAKPVNQSTVCSWCIGRYVPRIEMAIAIEQLTGIPVAHWALAAVPIPRARDSGIDVDDEPRDLASGE